MIERTPFDRAVAQFDKLDKNDRDVFISIIRENCQLKAKAKYDKIISDVRNGDCITGIDNIFKEVEKTIKPELKTTKEFVDTLTKLIVQKPNLYGSIKTGIKSLLEIPSAFCLENYKLENHLENYYSITITTNVKIIFAVNLKKGFIVLTDICSHDDVY
jgi:mRNA-degrading endonuclease YafQ of YafQ-DinJ toxin-antitoxin module